MASHLPVDGLVGTHRHVEATAAVYSRESVIAQAMRAAQICAIARSPVQSRVAQAHWVLVVESICASYESGELRKASLRQSNEEGNWGGGGVVDYFFVFSSVTSLSPCRPGDEYSKLDDRHTPYLMLSSIMDGFLIHGEAKR